MVAPELHRFASVAAYNAAFPACQMPTALTARHQLRGYHLAMRGLVDDLAGTPGAMIVDFLPGGPPAPGTPDRVGTVVASPWREAPILVLAQGVSLWAAWRTVVRRWPTKLSEVRDLLNGVESNPPR
ncbi:hypothetical protein [Actinophytocola glycyrrhizae]|uniref:Uncharacterized protein n=1 Tax=Actinophytocola glycyrrhizae TaxID=2044873 RepID=A0ABV9S7E9_9PSEU